MDLSVIGLGYVGLTTSVCLANRGFRIICFDVDQRKLNSIRAGEPPFHEPKLKRLLTKAMRDGSLRCATDPVEAPLRSQVTFLTVGTPSSSDGSIDLTQVKEASRSIGEALSKKHEWHLVVLKSTITPGTTENVVKPIIEKYSDKKGGEGFGLCYSPEFLREGSAVEDTRRPDRIIIGEFDKKSGDQLEKIYRTFHRDAVPPTVRTSIVNAELTKYVNNAFLAMKISFINMIANLCQELPEADVKVIAQGIGLDKRIGGRFLNAGVGWGGSCFKKDLDAIIVYAKQLGMGLPLVSATLRINEKQPLKAVELAKQLLGCLDSKRIAILGLAFKPNTDDMREAPSVKVINELLHERARVIAYDPVAMKNAQRLFHSKIGYASSSRECVRGADCVIILTEWGEFKELKDYLKLMKKPAIVDGRKVFNPEEFVGVKFRAVGLGHEIPKDKAHAYK